MSTASSDPVEDLLKRLWNFADMHDRVKRINAPMVLARGEELWQPDGYLNPSLGEGYNTVRAYLIDVAKDLGYDPFSWEV